MDFHYSVSTTKSVEEAVQAIEQNLQTLKFGVLWQLDLTAKLQSKGIPFERQYRVLEVCNPFEAANVLAKNDLVGYFLPCKVVVYEQNGQTHIGLPKPTALIGLLKDRELQAIAEKIEQTLIQVLESSK
ncbi:DUF302 domain-containing protein [Brevibacillus thermoruber]|uniref:DUF302 domain-containing protein n=1 Tax=Brevibacillus thermoruber TaxID=33942 RepID=A0A9X3Z5C9_9BACL|nr:DUF302 domain-containing protein [Brevibacillus thermoruber]MDA5110911.1 DUF302 domain-containing protein [Brevibacillus thermoruber]